MQSASRRRVQRALETPRPSRRIYERQVKGWSRPPRYHLLHVITGLVPAMTAEGVFPGGCRPRVAHAKDTTHAKAKKRPSRSKAFTQISSRGAVTPVGAKMGSRFIS